MVEGTHWSAPLERSIDEHGLDTIETERLDLVPITRKHAPVLFPVLAEPALYTWTGGTPPASVETLGGGFAVWERRRSPDGAELWLNWLVRVRATAEAAGYVQATVARSDDEAALAWVIGVPSQGRGLASEAARGVLEWLRAHGATRFRACVKPDHRASQRVAERLGLTRSGRWIAGEEVWTLELPEQPTEGEQTTEGTPRDQG